MENEVNNGLLSMESNSSSEEDEINMEDLCQLDEDTSEGNEQLNVGMLFSSMTDLCNQYQRYGKSKGFAVVKASRVKGTNGEQRFVTFTCHKARNWQGRGVNRARPVMTKLTGCLAKISASRCSDGRWKMNKFCDEHNHEPDASTSRYIRQHRVVSPYVKCRLEINGIVGIKPSRSIRALTVEAGGAEMIECLPNDCRNFIDKARSWRLGRGDAEAMCNMFVTMQNANSNFFYAIKSNEENRIKNVLSVDGHARAAYSEFNDVISFDSTYLVNRYDMPFAVFVGVNHHGQSLLLGCALLSDKEAKKYEWVFKTWLTSMGKQTPKAIIINQCRSMRCAIKDVMPNTKHHWCIWHIMIKFPEKMKRYERYSEMRDAFKVVVYDSDTRWDFRRKFFKFLNDFDLGDNEWLISIFEERQMWVPAYLSNTFWAGMQSTQRSEGMHVYFDSQNDSHGRHIHHRVAERICKGDNSTTEVFHDILFDKETRIAMCSCCKFKVMGIVCRHWLAILIPHNIADFPEAVILHRWRKDVCRMHSSVNMRYLCDTYDATRKALRDVEKVFYDTIHTINMNGDQLSELSNWISDFHRNLKNTQVDSCRGEYVGFSMLVQLRESFKTP